jgi:hypothetical protein
MSQRESQAMTEVLNPSNEFDVRCIPVEAEWNIDWNRVQDDFSVLASQSRATSLSGARKRPSSLYPVFEIAVWELDATWRLLSALDAHCMAQENKLMASGVAQLWAQQQLQNAEGELSTARTQFLEAFRTLNQKQRGNASDGESQGVGALTALNDLEKVWQSQTQL